MSPSSSLQLTDFVTVRHFAYVLDDANAFATKDDVLDYFERPWRWDEAYRIWVGLGKPRDDDNDWQQFCDHITGMEE